MYIARSCWVYARHHTPEWYIHPYRFETCPPSLPPPPVHHVRAPLVQGAGPPSLSDLSIIVDRANDLGELLVERALAWNWGAWPEGSEEAKDPDSGKGWSRGAEGRGVCVCICFFVFCGTSYVHAEVIWSTIILG